MAEIFDASGSMDSSGNAASSLAAALNNLASPLNDIAKNTAATADNTKDIRPNNDLEAFFSETKPLTDLFARPGRKQSASGKAGTLDMGALGKTSANTSPMNMAALAESAASRRATVTGAIPRAATQAFTPQTMATVTGSVTGQLSFLGRAAATLGPTLAAMGTATAAVAIPLAAVAAAGTAAAAGLAAIVGTARHFTQAFDPSMVLVFDAAMRDLNAVVGSMLVPIVGEATRVVKAFANQLYSGTNTIMPAIRTIAKSVGDVFIAFMPVVGQVTKIFGDMLVVVADWARTIADFVVPQVRAFGVVFAGWATAFKSIVAGMFPILGGTFKNMLVQVAQQMGKVAVVMSAVVFKLLGMKDALDAMTKSLSPEALKGRDAGGLAAAQNARMVAVASLGSEVLQRAFTTSGRTGKTEEEIADEQYRKDLQQLVANIKDFKLSDLPKLIGEAVVDAIFNRNGTRSDQPRGPVGTAIGAMTMGIL